MPVVVVGEERSLSQLRPRLIQGRVSRADNARLTEAVAAANPAVDLSKLAPGTVLTIPDLPELNFRPKITVVEDQGKLADGVFAEVDRTLTNLDRAAAERSKVERASRTALRRKLRSKDLEDRGKKDRALRENVAAAAALSEVLDETEKEASAGLQKALRQWTADLEKLRNLGLGDR